MDFFLIGKMQNIIKFTILTTFFLRFYLFIFTGRGGEGEKHRSLASLGTEIATQASAQTRNKLVIFRFAERRLTN